MKPSKRGFFAGMKAVVKTGPGGWREDGFHVILQGAYVRLGSRFLRLGRVGFSRTISIFCPVIFRIINTASAPN